MKIQHPLLAAALAVASLTASPTLHAESTYGYNAAGAGPVSAQARVNVNVNVPRLILLRVGTGDAAVNTETITAGLSLPGSPTDGNNQAFAWDGSSPTVLTTPSSGLAAYAWTNSSGGASINGSVSTPDAGTTGLTAADISVTVGNLGALPVLSHPGADTGTFSATVIPRNTVTGATWYYDVNPVAAAAAAAGAFSQTITYTATSL